MRKSIMPENKRYSTEQTGYLHRHEVFFGKNRQDSLKFGLFVYLTPAMHNMSDEGVHFNRDFDLTLKQIGQRAAMREYGWTVEDFISIFGRNYLCEINEEKFEPERENYFALKECAICF